LRQLGAELQVEAHELLACSLFHQGAFRQSVEHADRALALCRPEEHSALLALHGENAAVGSNDWAALSLWFLGYPDQALARAEHALALAERSIYSLATARIQAAFLHQFRREPDRTREMAEAAIALATRQGFPFRIAQATILLGWALSALGCAAEGQELLRQGLAAYQDTGAAMDRPFYLALYAEACACQGRPQEGLDALDEALAAVRGGRAFYYEGELHRLRGDLLLKSQAQDAEKQAEAAFQQALNVSRRQKARSLELRSAVSLSRLWQRRGRGEEARALLDEIYNGFTEGFDTPDLRQAKEVLEALTTPLGQGYRAEKAM
jgi:adenylate cyclase